MPARGAGASFKINGTETAQWLNEIGGDAAQDELDATTFNPNATQPTKTIFFGATERTFTLSGLWIPAVETFFSALEGVEGASYAYGPQGDVGAGKTLISGLCNIGSWTGPQQTALGLITFSITLKATTRVVSTL